MAGKTVKLTPPEVFHQFLELPLYDLMVPGISEYLELKDLFNFRCCSLYCKELADSAMAAQRSVVISKYQKTNTEAILRVITERCYRLREINLRNLAWLTDKLLIPLFSNNPLLKSVLLIKCKSLTPQALYPLAVNCKNLTCLNLDGGACDDTFLKMLNQSGIQLKEVSLYRAKGFSEEGLCSFFRKQPRLEIIWLPTLYILLPEVLDIIAESCQDLKSLCGLFLRHYQLSHFKEIKANSKVWDMVLKKSNVPKKLTTRKLCSLNFLEIKQLCEF